MIAGISTLCFAKHVNPQYKCPVVSMQKKESSIGTCPKGEKSYFQVMYVSYCCFNS